MVPKQLKLTKFRPGCTPVQALDYLKSALVAADQAEHCAVLWFAEIRRRRLFRQLGYSSMNQFAELELGFSRTRTGDFLRLAARLDELPRLRESMVRGQIGYSKAAEIIKVATPASESRWIKEAMDHPRQKLRAKVRAVREKARRRRQQKAGQLKLGEISQQEPLAEATGPGHVGEVSARKSGKGDSSVCGPSPAATNPASGTVPVEFAAAEIPVRLSLEFSPAQFARFEALLAKLQKAGYQTAGAGRAPLILSALAALVDEEMEPVTAMEGGTAEPSSSCKKESCQAGARRRAPVRSRRSRRGAGPPAQIHVYQCPDCRRATVRTSRGELNISPTTFERLACDARIDQEGKPNRSTIPPRVRRAVLARDRHRCQAPGCRHIHHLEVHHIVPRNKGGANRMDNLITLCSGCHRIWHEKGGPPPGWKLAAEE